MAGDGHASATESFFRTIAKYRNLEHVWQVAANNDDVDKWIKYEPQFVTPHLTLVKTRPFPSFQPPAYVHKKCPKRALSCASDGEKCFACGKKCEPKEFVGSSFYDRRMHLIHYGVLK
jgi:hypothetical protein